MYTTAHPFYIQTRSPLHAGSGSDLGVVDLPIQRERHTGHPKIEGASLKGAIREAFRHVEALEDPQRDALFGPDPGPEDDVDLHAGAVGVTNARILLFPIKSLRGVYAWTTCPSVLKRWRDELRHAGVEADWSVPRGRRVTPGSDLVVGDGRVVLEEHTIDVQEEEVVDQLAFRIEQAPGLEEVGPRLLVLTDDAFRDFAEMATEVITRTKITPDTGTVQEGQLFTEEYLPPESVLYFLGMGSSLKNGNGAPFDFDEREARDEQVLEAFRSHLPEALQIGANATTGKGLVSIHS